MAGAVKQYVLWEFSLSDESWQPVTVATENPEPVTREDNRWNHVAKWFCAGVRPSIHLGMALIGWPRRHRLRWDNFAELHKWSERNVGENAA